MPPAAYYLLAITRACKLEALAFWAVCSGRNCLTSTTDNMKPCTAHAGSWGSATRSSVWQSAGRATPGVMLCGHPPFGCPAYLAKRVSESCCQSSRIGRPAQTGESTSTTVIGSCATRPCSAKVCFPYAILLPQCASTSWNT